MLPTSRRVRPDREFFTTAGERPFPTHGGGSKKEDAASLLACRESGANTFRQMSSVLLILAQAAPDNATGLFFGLGAFALVLAIVVGIFWLWMLIDALTNDRLDSTMRIVWAAVIFFFPFIGALVYLFVGRRGSSAARPV